MSEQTDIDQCVLQDPTTQYPKPDASWRQYQEGAGTEVQQHPKPDDYPTIPS